MKTAKIVQIDIPNKNGRIYPKKCMENAIAAWQRIADKKLGTKDVMPIFKEVSFTNTAEDIVGYATDVRIEDNFLLAEVWFIEDKVQFLNNHEIINIRPNGVGTVKDNIVQSDYRINGFAIVRKPA